MMTWCDCDNDLVNVNGPATLMATRPLASFFADPRTIYQHHDQKPPGDRPPAQTIPVGPQLGPGFRPVGGGVRGPVYDPPDFAWDGWVPGGLALRLGA